MTVRRGLRDKTIHVQVAAGRVPCAGPSSIEARIRFPLSLESK